MYYLTKKRMVLFSGLLFAVLILFFSLVLPAIKEIKIVRGRIVNKMEELNTIKALGREYIRTKEELRVLERSAIGIDEKTVLLSAIERLLVNAGIDKESVTINSKHKNILPPVSKKDIEIKFEKVSYEELKSFFLAIREYSSTLHLKRIHIKTRFDNPSFLNGSIQVSVLEKE